MTKLNVNRISSMILVTILLLASGCAVVPGRVRTESETVSLEGAESVRVEIFMRAGRLMVDGGADPLMEAEFTYNVQEWQPEVTYTVDGGQGELVVEQPGMEEPSRLIGETRNEWDLQFREGVPLDMELNLPAGECTLNVASLTLTNLEINAGAGDCTLDLAGDWEQDLDVSIQAGVGQLSVLLPDDIGVQATVQGGIGEVDAPGLQRDGETYVNDAYGESDVTLTLDIRGGVGQIELLTE